MNHSKIQIATILSIAAIALFASMGTIALSTQASARAQRSHTRAGHAAASLWPRGQQRLRHHHRSAIAGTTNSVTPSIHRCRFRPLHRQLIEHGEASLRWQALPARRHRARPQLQPRSDQPQPHRAPGPGQSEIAAARCFQRQRLSRRILQQANLAAEGLRIHIPIPGLASPPSSARTTTSTCAQRHAVGPRSHRMEQLPRLQRIRPRRAVLRPRCARRRVLAVCALLQIIATRERVASAHAQLDTATALFQQTQQKARRRLSPQIDVDRSEVEQLTSSSAHLARNRAGQAEDRTRPHHRTSAQRRLRPYR